MLKNVTIARGAAASIERLIVVILAFFLGMPTLLLLITYVPAISQALPSLW